MGRIRWNRIVARRGEVVLAWVTGGWAFTLLRDGSVYNAAPVLFKNFMWIPQHVLGVGLVVLAALIILGVGNMFSLRYQRLVLLVTISWWFYAALAFFFATPLLSTGAAAYTGIALLGVLAYLNLPRAERE